LSGSWSEVFPAQLFFNSGAAAAVAPPARDDEMRKRKIGPFEVNAIGLGCMNLSHAYGPPISAAQGERVLLAALDAGVDHFDSAALYGFGANEELVGRVLKPHRQSVMLTSKGGMTGIADSSGVKKRVIDGRPEAVIRDCEDSLRRLGTDVIDLYYLHRWDKNVPIEESVGAMGELVRKGHVRAIGLSEVSAATLKRAHGEHKISAIQTEYSLWTRNPEIAVLNAAAEVGAAFVAFSPLARGFLTGALTEVGSFDARDIRRAMPRFDPKNYLANLKLLPAYKEVAQDLRCTPAQLALAWLLAKSEAILPIPGTTSVAHLKDNLGAANVEISAEAMRRLDDILNPSTVLGERYNAATSREVDTENFEGHCA
jgi:aryl-alcohol dehydrogenase-like predicted oxidoreductase